MIDQLKAGSQFNTAN